jgi:hypothetical protein
VRDDLSTVLADYRAGLDVQLQLLAQLEAIACQQHDASPPLAPDQVATLGDVRQRLMDQLVEVEARVRPLRDGITARLDEARRTPGFELVSHRHRVAAAAVARIMATDAATLQALQSAEATRRSAAQILETGEVTLAAYRRVLLGATMPAGLVNQRG